MVYDAEVGIDEAVEGLDRLTGGESVLRSVEAIVYKTVDS